jgi:hypothetical protein
MLYNLLLPYEPLLSAVRQEWLDRFLSLEFDEKKAGEVVLYFIKEIHNDATDEDVKIVFVDGLMEAQKLFNTHPSILQHHINFNDIYFRLYTAAQDKLADYLVELLFTDNKEILLQQLAKSVDRFFSWNHDLLQGLAADEVSFVKDETTRKLMTSSTIVSDVSKQVKYTFRTISNRSSNLPFFPFWNTIPLFFLRNSILSVTRSDVYTLVGHGTFSDFEWVSLYDGLRRAGLVEVEGLSHYMSLVRANIFFWIPSHEGSVVCRPPEIIRLDERNRLHCVDGCAVRFRDGYGQFWVHGVNFDEKTFETFFSGNRFTPRDILTLRNVEQRIALMQHFGIETIFDHIRRKRRIDIDECVSGITGKPAKCELYDCELEDMEPVRLLKLEDHTTHKPVVLAVPLGDDTNTCKKAVAWTFGMTKEEYKLDFES